MFISCSRTFLTVKNVICIFIYTGNCPSNRFLLNRVKISHKTKQLLGSFSKISLATPDSDEKSSCLWKKHTTRFYMQFHFRIELFSGLPQIRLKVEMKLLAFFRLSFLDSNSRKLLRIFDSSLEYCLSSCYDFGKSVARPVKNPVAYEKMCSANASSEQINPFLEY